MPENTDRSTLSKILLRIVFVIAIIITIALFAVAIIRYSPRFFSYIGSLFNVFEESTLKVEVTPQTVMSGEKVTLSWPTLDQESVSLTYVCSNEYSLSFLGGSSTVMPITCGKAFELGGKTGGATLIPKLQTANSFSDIEIIVNQEKIDDSSAEGIALITVTSGSKPSITTTTPIVATTTPSTVKPTPAKPVTITSVPQSISYVPAYSGPADLIVAQPTYVNGAVQFVISNLGGSNTGNWILAATLPNGETFNAGTIANLTPGSSILFTLNLGTATGGTVRIFADTTNAVSESNENNNTNEVTFGTGGGTTSNGKADLQATVISIASVRNDEVSITFRITNNGGTTARDWRFEVELPTDNEDTYRSAEQTDLKSGEYAEYTLRFTNPDSNGYATIEVDSEDNVNESSENNNRTRFRVTN